MKRVIVHLASSHSQPYDTTDDFTKFIEYIGDTYPTDMCEHDYSLDDYEKLTLKFYATPEGADAIQEWIPDVSAEFGFSVVTTDIHDADPADWATYCEDNDLEEDMFEE